MHSCAQTAEQTADEFEFDVEREWTGEYPVESV